MSSARQIEANRLNALKSTGPRTAAGKAVSSMNALETGIDAASLFIPGECLATLFALSKEYVDHYQPATPAERTLVDSLLRQEWLLRRFTLIESHLWRKQMDELSAIGQLDKQSAFGHAFLQLDKTLSRLQRRLDSTERSYRTTLHELERSQAAPPPETEPDPDPAPDSVPQPTATEPVTTQIGFVPQPASPAPGPAARSQFEW